MTSDPTWLKVFQEMAERLSKIDAASIPWKQVDTMVEKLIESGISIQDNYGAVIAFRAGNYHKAVNLWEAAGQTGLYEYKRARAMVSPFPENITWFCQAKDYQEVLRQWQDNKHEVDYNGPHNLDSMIRHS